MKVLVALTDNPLQAPTRQIRFDHFNFFRHVAENITFMWLTDSVIWTHTYIALCRLVNQSYVHDYSKTKARVVLVDPFVPLAAFTYSPQLLGQMQRFRFNVTQLPNAYLRRVAPVELLMRLWRNNMLTTAALFSMKPGIRCRLIKAVPDIYYVGGSLPDAYQRRLGNRNPRFVTFELASGNERLLRRSFIRNPRLISMVPPSNRRLQWTGLKLSNDLTLIQEPTKAMIAYAVHRVEANVPIPYQRMPDDYIRAIIRRTEPSVFILTERYPHLLPFAIKMHQSMLRRMHDNDVPLTNEHIRLHLNTHYRTRLAPDCTRTYLLRRLIRACPRFAPLAMDFDRQLAYATVRAYPNVIRHFDDPPAALVYAAVVRNGKMLQRMRSIADVHDAHPLEIEYISDHPSVNLADYWAVLLEPAWVFLWLNATAI